MTQPFVLGINYWPRRKAMNWWHDFDAAEVHDEFRLIREVGLSLVRIFLLWEDWQPTPNTVNPTALRDLITVADIAYELGLKLDITFFTGHMSGPNWAPDWMLLPDTPMPPSVNQVVSGGKVVNCGYRNPYTDIMTLMAERLLLTTVVKALRGHPGVGVWNLGNEPDLFGVPPNAAAGRAWAQEMVNLIRGLDSDTPITCGLHVPSLTEDNGLRVSDIGQAVDVPAIHGYPMYADWARDPLDPDFVPFLCALTTALTGKPTLAEEFGGCTVGPGEPSTVWEWVAFARPRTQFMASETDFAAYIEQVLPKLVEVGATGALLWCFADYTPDLYGYPPCDEAIHERFFGLVRPDGSLKPHAGVLRRFAAANPTVPPATRTVTLGISPDEYYADPLTHCRRLYQTFIAQDTN